MSSSDSEPGATAPRVVMFAGPNGSGKSTINAAILKDPDFGFVGEYINADDIAPITQVFDARRNRSRTQHRSSEPS